MRIKMSRNRFLQITAVIAAVLIIGTGAWVFVFSGTDGDNPGNLATFAVQKGPLIINVTDSATIQPREQLTIKSEVEGTTTILYLIPEGTHVKKGDLLVELDATNLEDSKVDREISVQNAEASYISARENLEVVRNQAQSDVEQAELALRFAKQDLEKYTEGDYPNQVRELEAKITLANEELERAIDDFNWSKTLFEEKYLSESEYKADELAKNKAELDLELAQNNLKLLKEYTYKRTIEQLQSDVRQAEMALERTKRKASANVVQAEAELKAKESSFTREKSKLEKIKEQIEKAKIIAPMDGLVVYATSVQVSFRRNVEPLDEGQQVRERQELIYLPTTSTFKAEAKIHESSLEKIKPGLPVRITVDALPGKVFTGKVATIAPLPDAQSMFMNPDLKVYDTEIHIEGGEGVLRSGMTCKAEIIVEEYPSAMYVPIQSVFRVKGQPTAFIRSGDTVEPRPVKIGLDNNRMVHIISGLAPGEEVLLNPPLETAVAVREPMAETGSETGEEAAAESPPAAAKEDEASVEPRETGPSTEEQPSASEESASERRRPDRNFEDLTPEERQKLRERFENMSPEEREAMRQRRRQMQQDSNE
jgi:HlyD family secretion protein